jgi:hypothetical protein
MTQKELDDYRHDASELLGAAAHLLGAVGNGRGSEPIVRTMAAEWAAGYARYSRGERSALPWVGGRDWRPATDERDGHGCPDCPPLPARCLHCDGFGTCLHCDGGGYRSALCRH